jgi:FAD/FMN-containing dehydrogenase
MDAAPVPPAYLEDASNLRGHAERLFVPADEAALSAVLREASAGGTPVTIAGAGTGVTGARVPFGGWVVSLEKFNRLEIASGHARCGAGVLLRDLHAGTQARGQFYPPDPTETGAAIGGNIATNASGSRSFLYGSTRRWIESLRVVLADGTVREFARGEAIDFDPGSIPLPAVTKNTAGYLLSPGMDWVDLICGSEGTLGVVTEARVRLLPAPKSLLAGVIFFPSDDLALDAVEAWPRTLRMLEYMDAHSLDIVRARYSEIPPEAAAALLIEQELESDDSPEVDAWIDRIESSGALLEVSWFAAAPADRERFRVFRHTLPELVNDRVRRSGALKMNTDYAVPLSANRAMLAAYRRVLDAEFPGRYVLFGHIGDAHVHVNLFSDPANPAHATEVLAQLAREAVALGGTVSAEHGLGKRKAHLLEIQYTPDQIAAMRVVKRGLDPVAILGRGTLFPQRYAF